MIREIKNFLILAFFLLVSCNDEIPEPANPDAFKPLTPAEQNLLNSSNEFSFELTRLLGTQNPGQNIFFSPISIGNGIGMAINLIEDKPKEELKKFLQIPDIEDIEIDRAYYRLSEIIGKIDRSISINFGNSLWINNQYTISELTGNKLMAYYNAEVDLLNFSNESSVKTINRWVSASTGDRMSKIIRTMDPKDHAYIINAVDFDLSLALTYGQIQIPGWKFILADGSEKSCEIIKPDVTQLNYFYQDKISMIDIPLGNGRIHMVVLMPDDRERMKNLLSSINPGLVKEYIDRGIPVDKEVIFPKINMNHTIRLKGLFPKMGITGPIAATKYYFDERDIFISDFIHKSSLSFKSTNIAPTANIPLSMEEVSPDLLQVNKPFMILIRENFTGGILFNGLIYDPTQE